MPEGGIAEVVMTPTGVSEEEPARNSGRDKVAWAKVIITTNIISFVTILKPFQPQPLTLGAMVGGPPRSCRVCRLARNGIPPRGGPSYMQTEVCASDCPVPPWRANVSN